MADTGSGRPKDPDKTPRQERNDFEPTTGRSDPDRADRSSRDASAANPQEDQGDAGDTRVTQPGDEPAGERVVSLGDLGETPRGQGQDRMGGYGNEPVPQEPGPDQDEGLHN